MADPSEILPSSSDDSTESESEDVAKNSSKASKKIGPPAPKKKKKKQGFCYTWLQMSEFKSWLSKTVGKDGSVQPFCVPCQMKVMCSKTGLQRHAKSVRHQENSKSTKSSQPITTLWSSPDDKIIELRVCAFIAENALALFLSESIVTVLRSLFPTNTSLKSVRLRKQKATNIVRQVFAFDYLKEAVTRLRENKFGIIIDEATDKSSLKQLAILATYFDTESFETKNFLVDMVECADGKADSIYKALKETFQEHHIPMENIIGYSSDTTNVMFGERHSVSQLLRSEFPHIFTIKCSCHLIHLASSYAALKLPKSLEDLCRDIFAHFSRSAKRQDAYKEFQAFFDVQPRKLLSPAKTRWLSLQACVNRILEQYEALKYYFILVAIEDPTYSNDRINASLSNHFTRAYLEFLSFQLERLNSFNRLFQSEKPLLHCLRGEVLLTYVKSTEAQDIDPADVQFHVPLHRLYLGVAATTTLQEMTGARSCDVDTFRNDCKNFLIECIHQIKARFDIKSEIHDIAESLKPQNASQVAPPSLGPIADKLPYLKESLDIDELDREWRQHTFESGLTEDLMWDQYWLKVRDAKNPSGTVKYPTLVKFVGMIASFPCSNAPVERIFSSLKLIKSDRRSSLKSATLVSLMQTRFAMKLAGTTAADFVPSKNLLSLLSKMKASATDAEARELKMQYLDTQFGNTV